MALPHDPETYPSALPQPQSIVKLAPTRIAHSATSTDFVWTGATILTLVILLLAQVLEFLDTTVVNVALPTMRHLLVIGATRHTGNLVMQQALTAGHTVTALARDPARIDVQHERLRVVRGDVMDPATLVPAMVGCDAVVSALGATSKVRAARRSIARYTAAIPSPAPTWPAPSSRCSTTLRRCTLLSASPTE